MSLDINKITLVVDIRGWAFDNIAKSTQSSLGQYADLNILYWEDYNKPSELLDAIGNSKSELIHFFFREHLNVLINTTDKSNKNIEILCDKTITTHIPDYLYADENSLRDRHTLFNFCDAYFTINNDLFELYSSNFLIPHPTDVIYDNPSIPLIKQNKTSTTPETITIVWSGNSQWGEYAGYIDYKGVKNIITPAIEQLRDKHKNIKYISFDSSKVKTSNEVILETLENADILLIASEKEGTPLTLIEAISRHCAIVSTRTGIATEILSEIQQDFLCDRSHQAFYNALERLVTNGKLLKQCKDENYQSYLKYFGPEGTIPAQWVRFFNAAHQKHKKDGQSRKNNLLQETKSTLSKRIAISSVRTGARLAQKAGLVPTLRKISPVFASTYHRILHGNGLSKANYDQADQIYNTFFNQSDKNKPIAVYSPMWKGVAASTEAIFNKNAIRFPFYDTEYPEAQKHKYLGSIAEKLASLEKQPIIYSGGSAIHITLAKKIRELNPDIKQYFMWHGSPSQWIDPEQYNHFLQWKRAYNESIINGFITVKQDLHNILSKLGIISYDIYNPLPNLVNNSRKKIISGTPLNVGLFSAISSWQKNPYVQLLALAGKNVVLNTNIDKNIVAELNLKLSGTHFFNHMPRHDFIRLLEQQDINLYITNTECSPMTALESWALNIPCIVGPAGDIYSQVDKKLAHYLIEQHVDDPNAIADRFDLVVENMNEIIDMLKTKKEKYNILYNNKIEDLYKNIMQ